MIEGTGDASDAQRFDQKKDYKIIPNPRRLHHSGEEIQKHFCDALLGTRPQGQFDANQVPRYETEALVDTGAMQYVIPPAVAERLGLLRLWKRYQER